MPPKRATISGRRVLFAIALALLALTAVLYIALVRLKLGGTDAIRLRPAPATGAGPSQ